MVINDQHWFLGVWCLLVVCKARVGSVFALASLELEVAVVQIILETGTLVPRLPATALCTCTSTLDFVLGFPHFVH